MKKIPALQWFLNGLLYSHAWIAFCALCMVWQTQLTLAGHWSLDALAGFVFCATLFLYAIHRIVGMRKVRSFAHKGRYRFIAAKRLPILLTGLLGGSIAAWFLWSLPASLYPWLLPPTLLSLAYVLPLFGRRRLRDFHFSKIFLIALVWAWVSVILPAVCLSMEGFIPTWSLFLERAFFIFAITIPFDIRDLQVDRYTGVWTIPGRWGVAAAKGIGLFALLLCLVMACLHWRLHVYATPTFWAVFGSLLAAAAVIWFSDKQRHDYYFSGLADGMMAVQFAAVALSHAI